MVQGTLLQHDSIQHQQATFGNITAKFMEVGENMYDILLEISSHKFYVRTEIRGDCIQSFEVVTAKSFMEITQQSVQTIKRLTEHLRCRMQ